MNELSLIQKLENAKNNRKKLPIPTSWDEGVDCAFNAAIVISKNTADDLFEAMKGISWNCCEESEESIECISILEAEELINQYLGIPK